MKTMLDHSEQTNARHNSWVISLSMGTSYLKQRKYRCLPTRNVELAETVHSGATANRSGNGAGPRSAGAAALAIGIAIVVARQPSRNLNISTRPQCTCCNSLSCNCRRTQRGELLWRGVTTPVRLDEVQNEKTGCFRRALASS